MSNHPSKTRAIQIIRRAFDTAPVIHSGFRELIGDTLFQECEAAERQHRRARSRLSVSVAAKYFAVKYIRDYLLHGEKMPTVKEYLNIRSECFTAASIVLNYGAELDAWVKSIPDEFDAIDYARMMQWDYYAEQDRKGRS